MRKLIIFLTLLVPHLCYAQIYGLIQGGYSQLNLDSASSHKVYPTGLAYAAGIGVRKQFFELEATLQKFTGQGELEHDGVKNKFIHEQSSVLFALNFYLSKRFYARLGYGFHKVDQSLDQKVSTASDIGARKAYGMKKDIMTDGILYGAGFVLYDGTRMAIYTQIESTTMSSLGASVWNGALGIKIYTN